MAGICERLTFSFSIEVQGSRQFARWIWLFVDKRLVQLEIWTPFEWAVYQTYLFDIVQHVDLDRG